MITTTKPDLPPLDEYVKYLRHIWKTRWLTNNGELVQELERKLKEYLKIDHIALVNNGTLAIHIAIKALNIFSGEIITTPYTFAATTNVIIWERLKPIFVDIDPETFNIDPQQIEDNITDKTKAILAVHVYGNPCYVEEIQKIAEKYDIYVIYDGAHAFGVEYKNNSVFKYGTISTLSFHATKVFHTIEGGALVTKDEKLIEKVKLLRNHGIKSEDDVVLPGTNAKMNEFQAAMGLCNLKYIDENIKKRKEIYTIYKEELGKFDVGFQKIIASKYNYSYMPVVFKDNKTREKVYKELLKNNIKARRYFYPITTKFRYFKNISHIDAKNLKYAQDISNRILCLPIYPTLTHETLIKIIGIIREIIK